MCNDLQIIFRPSVLQFGRCPFGVIGRVPVKLWTLWKALNFKKRPLATTLEDWSNFHVDHADSRTKANHAPDRMQILHKLLKRYHSPLQSLQSLRFKHRSRTLEDPNSRHHKAPHQMSDSLWRLAARWSEQKTKPLLLRPHLVQHIVCSPNFHDLLAGEFAYCTANVHCSRPNMFELWSYQRTWQATGFLGPRYLRSGYLGLARSSTSCNLPKFQIFFCESKGSIEEHR